MNAVELIASTDEGGEARNGSVGRGSLLADRLCGWGRSAAGAVRSRRVRRGGMALKRTFSCAADQLSQDGEGGGGVVRRSKNNEKRIDGVESHGGGLVVWSPVAEGS